MKQIHILISLLLLSLGVRAQQPPAKTCYWLNAQAGTGTYELNVAAQAGLLIRDKNMLLVKLEMNGNIGDYRNGRHEADLAGVLFGQKLTRGRSVYLTAAAGLGAVYFETRGDYIDVQGTPAYGPAKTFTRPGLPLEVKLWANPLPVLGFTLSASATLTREQTFGQVSLGLSIGKLRRIR